jgi:glycosyltransferase involved in cell wall biosynthesis
MFAAHRRDTGWPALHFITHKVPRLWQALNRADADIYLCRGASWLAGVVTLHAARRGKRSVFWAASDEDANRPLAPLLLWRGPPAWLARYGMTHANLIVAQTGHQQQAFAQWSSRPCALVRNILPGPEPPPNMTDDGHTVLWVGNFRAAKRPAWCLEVARRVPEASFVLVGGRNDNYPRMFDEVAEQAAAMPNVRLLGHVPVGQVGAHFACATVLLSTSAIEGSPNVFLQAWDAGKPVVSTVDPDGAISREGLGRHAADPDDLAKAVRTLLAAPEERKRIGVRARAYVRSNHSECAVIPRLESLLLRLSRS